jgi:pSer/pThr/pTyr-binding forkhead associated (FHA) protein
MQAKLIVVSGDIGRAEIPLKLPAVIGRSREATLTLPHPLVSRRHCELFERNGRLVVRDLGSRNGTYIANKKVTEAELPSGALLTIGTITFRAEYQMTPQESPTSTGQSGGSGAPRIQLSDSVVRITESELYSTEGLSDESFGIDSGHFGSSAERLDE